MGIRMGRNLGWHVLFVLILGSTTCPIAAGQEPRYDAPAPPLALEVLQPEAGVNASWESLEGHAVILEFWATWCGGCVANIPHMNSLVDRFRGKPVVFISVTDEDRDVVSRFLSKRPISGWVALDVHGSTFREYDIIGRPRAALVDRSGVLRGIVDPASLSEIQVDELLKGTLRVTQVEDTTPTIGGERDAPLPVLQVLIRPAVPSPGMSPGAVRLRGNLWETWGLTLKTILGRAYRTPVSRIIVPDSYQNARYDLLVAVPDYSKTTLRTVLQQVIPTGFQVAVRFDKRETEVYVLKTLDGGPQFQPFPRGQPLQRVASMAEEVLGVPVVDETGLAGNYDFVLGFSSNRTALVSDLRRLGLQLVPERRVMEMLIAEPSRSSAER